MRGGEVPLVHKSSRGELLGTGGRHAHCSSGRCIHAILSWSMKIRVEIYTANKL